VVFEEVFQFVLAIAEVKKLIDGQTVGGGHRDVEANAAMKSIVRKDTGEDWREFVMGLMRAADVIGEMETPTAEEVHRFDKKRKDKKVSNDEWESKTNPYRRM